MLIVGCKSVPIYRFFALKGSTRKEAICIFDGYISLAKRKLINEVREFKVCI